jgi:tripartite-type tricarboxylate transporter receptor subunit TctC
MSQPLRRLTCIAAVAAFAIAGGARAETALVVPFPPGGGSSFAAGYLADALPRALGEPVVVVHRPGGDGTVAVDAVSQAPPDGRTLLVGSTSSMVFAPLAQGRAPFDPTLDFALIGVIGTVPRVLVINPSLPVRNVDELIRYARESPGALACGMADRLSEHAVKLFERQAGVHLDCVAYDGVAALREALLSGQRKFALESALVPEVQEGRLRALAVASPTRMKALPDVPTASEAGMPALDARTWLALFAPKGTDGARVNELSNALAATLQNPRVAALLESRGYVVRPMTAGQARTYLQRDMLVWRRTVSLSPHLVAPPAWQEPDRK